MTPQPSEQPRTQSEQAAMADAQWKQDSRLRQVLNAWDHGPEFIESLLGWGFRIEAEAAVPDPVASPAEALRLLRALVEKPPATSGEPDAMARWTAWGEGVSAALDEARRYLAATEEGT